jgi:hypothetical protein
MAQDCSRRVRSSATDRDLSPVWNLITWHLWFTEEHGGTRAPSGIQVTDSVSNLSNVSNVSNVSNATVVQATHIKEALWPEVVGAFGRLQKGTIPTNRPPPSSKLVQTFSDRARSMVSVTVQKVVNLDFLDRRSYYFFQVALQLSSRGWVDPVPNPLYLTKWGSAGNRNRDLWNCSEVLWPIDHRSGLFILLPFTNYVALSWPSLWSSSQSSWLLTQKSWVQFPALPDFLSSSGFGTGPLSPWEDEWGVTWKKSSGSGVENGDQWPEGIRRADHATTFHPQKLALNFTKKWQSLSRYSSVEDKTPRSLFVCFVAFRT